MNETVMTVLDILKFTTGTVTGLGVDFVVNIAGAKLYTYVKNPTKIKRVLFAVGTNAIGGYLGAQCIKVSNAKFDQLSALLKLAEVTNKEEQDNGK